MSVCVWSIPRPVLHPADTSGLFSVHPTTTSLSWADCTSGNLSMRVGFMHVQMSTYCTYVILFSFCCSLNYTVIWIYQSSIYLDLNAEADAEHKVRFSQNPFGAVWRRQTQIGREKAKPKNQATELRKKNITQRQTFFKLEKGWKTMNTHGRTKKIWRRNSEWYTVAGW